jgi:SAM-dependent MidA family methyltransferase
MNAILEKIRAEIVSRGPMSLARFMEWALYAPGDGYYERNHSQTGQRGDFYTSVSVGNLFGELLAFQFADWAAPLSGERRQIVEAGAHDGQLASDILHWLEEHRANFFANLDYWILEPSGRRRAWQEKKLARWRNKIRWFEGWGEIPAGAISGVIISNELLDAFPAHRVGWDAPRGCWFEWGVDWKEDRLVWARLPREQSALRETAWPNLPLELLRHLPDRFTTEICPEAEAWWGEAALRLGAGKLLTFDYGRPAEEFWLPERAGGTLRAYSKHRVHAEVLENPGEQDVTADVNFSAIQAAGEAAGLRTETMEAQARFLTRIAERGFSSDAGNWSSSRVRQFQTLTHPEHLGRAFKVLVQERGGEPHQHEAWRKCGA